MLNTADAKHKFNEIHAYRSKHRISRLIIKQINDEIWRKVADESN
jgi:hypothetical protein